MSKMNNIDKLFREKLKDDQATYKPEYWERMESMLNNKPAGGTSSLTTLFTGRKILGLTVIAALITTALIIFNTDTGDEPIVTEQNTNPQKEEIANATKTSSEPDESIRMSEQITEETISEYHNNIMNAPDGPVADPATYRQGRTTSDQPDDEDQEDLHIENKTTELQAPSSDNTETEKPTPLKAEASKRNGLTASRYISAEHLTLSIPEADSAGTPPDRNPNLRNFYLNLSLYGGLNHFKAFSNQAGAAASFSNNLVAGLCFDLNFKNYFDLSIEPAYVLRTGNSLHQQNTVVNYLYVKEVIQTDVSTDALHFIHVPVYMNYDFGKRHMLKAGFFGSILVGSSGEKTITTSTPDHTTVEKTDVTNYRKNLNDVSYGLSLGYDLKVNRYVTAGIRYNQGFNDFADDKVYLQDNNDLLQEIQLVIKVHLF